MPLLGSNITKLKNSSDEHTKLKAIKHTSPRVFTLAFFVAITSNLAPIKKITIAKRIDLVIQWPLLLPINTVL